MELCYPTFSSFLRRSRDVRSDLPENENPAYTTQTQTLGRTEGSRMARHLLPGLRCSLLLSAQLIKLYALSQRYFQ